jgi:hypothetical protein
MTIVDKNKINNTFLIAKCLNRLAGNVGALPTLGDLMLVKPGTSSRTLI